MVRFLPLACIFIAWLCVFSTYGNAAKSLYDKQVDTQSQSAVAAASTNPADSNDMPYPGFPISIGGGGDSNGGGGWLRVWTPFGWIVLGGGGDSHGGGGGGGFEPFVPPLSPEPKSLSHSSNPELLSSDSQLPPWLAPFFRRHPSPQRPSIPVMPHHPYNPTPGFSRPPLPPWLAPFFRQPSPPSPSNPPVRPSNPNIPKWLAPYIGSDGRLHEPPSPPRTIPKWLAPYIGSDGRLHEPPSPPSPPRTIPKWLAPYIGSDGRLHEPPSPPRTTPKFLAPYIGSDGRLHLPDEPSQPIPSWLKPYIGSNKPAAGNSMGTQSEGATGVETSKTSVKESDHHYQCWLPLEKTDTCVDEILTAFSSRKFEVIGSACCSAIEKMDRDCHARTIGNFHDHFFSASVHRHCSAN